MASTRYIHNKNRKWNEEEGLTFESNPCCRKERETKSQEICSGGEADRRKVG